MTQSARASRNTATNVIELRQRDKEEHGQRVSFSRLDARRAANSAGHNAVSPETINLHVVRQDFAIVHIRVAGGLHLRNMGAKRGPDGSVRISFPRIISRNGTDHGFAYALPPGQREQLECAIGALWAQIITSENEGNAL